MLAVAVTFFMSWYDAANNKRITDILDEYATQEHLFSSDKIVSVREGGPLNLNGDESVYATYQLSAEDTNKLLQEKQLLKCDESNECNRENQNISRPNNYTYCEYGRLTSSDFMISLCIDSQKQKATWYYSTY